MMAALVPGLNELFGLEYDGLGNPLPSVWNDDPMLRGWLDHGWDDLPGFDERYVHETVAMGYTITEEAIEQDLYDSLSERYTKALAKAMTHPR